MVRMKPDVRATGSNVQVGFVFHRVGLVMVGIHFLKVERTNFNNISERNSFLGDNDCEDMSDESESVSCLFRLIVGILGPINPTFSM